MSARTIMTTVLAAATVCAAAGEKAGPDTDKKAEAYPAKKILQVREHLADIMRLTLAEDRLRVDRDHWEKAARGDTGGDEKTKEVKLPKGAAARLKKRLAGRANIAVRGNVLVMTNTMGRGGALGRLFQRLRSAAGGQGTSMRSGMKSRSMSFNGGGLSVNLQDGEGMFQAAVKEECPGGLTVSLSQRDERLSILIVAPGTGSVLMLRQEADGTLVVKEMVGDEAKQFEAGGFAAFFEQHDDYAVDHLLPLLHKAGIAFPVGSGSDPRTIKAVIDVLRFIRDRDGAAEFAALLEKLDADAYAEREAATKKLTGEFLLFYPFLPAARKRDDIPPEAAARLEAVVKNCTDSMDLVNAVYTLNRHRDPAYLAGILEKVEGKERTIVLDALKRLTGEDFGDDVAAWKQSVAGDN